MIRTLLLFAALFQPSGDAAAQPMLKGIEWRIAHSTSPKTFVAIEKWPQPPALKLASKPRAVLTMINRGPNRAEGVVIYYAVSMRLAKLEEKDSEGVWTAHFWTEERRVPMLKPNETREIPIENLRLITFLKRMHRAGFWPKAVKIEAMVEPRPGQSMEPPAVKELLVAWE